jgi:photosystem II stability/assembly factor-like uncharacterized protein
MITLALTVIIAAGFVYLRPTLTAPPTTKSHPTSPLLATSHAIEYKFVSPLVGWALDFSVGQAQPVAAQFWILRTTDGGMHWQTQLMGQNGLKDLTAESIQMFDRDRGFIYVRGLTDLLFRTTDSGEHWLSISLPASRLFGVTFRDPSNGWLLAITTSTLGPAFNLYATSDSGATWHRLPDPPDATHGLTLRRATEAWLASAESGPPRVYKSTDSGLTWHSLVIPYPPGSASSPTSNWSTSIRLLPGVGVIASVSCECTPTSSYNFSSFDNGTTWRYLPAAAGSVAYEDDLHWWLINARTLYRSIDSGQTWIKISDQLPNWEFDPHALDSRHAWAQISEAGVYGLALTDDAGIHWTRVTVPHPDTRATPGAGVTANP